MSLFTLTRPLLHAMDPERAHALTLDALDRAQASGLACALFGPAVDDPVEVLGLRFRNRVGLAAGLDKNGAHVDGLAAMGFGFVEVGTVTPRAQPGNPRPRIFRLPARDALINRMGFNNDGVAHFCAQIDRSAWQGVLGLNIGKNAATPIEQAIDDYLLCLDAVYSRAGYVTVNVSSPNTSNLRQLQEDDALDAMLGALRERQLRLSDRHRRYVPLALKIAPDLDSAQIEAIAQRLVRHGIDAVIATNTTVARDAVAGLRHGDEIGGLSGRPVFESSNRVIRALRALLPPAYPIIGVGGILSGADAVTKIEAGATLVQLYTGLIYRGPALVRECAQALARHAARHRPGPSA